MSGAKIDRESVLARYEASGHLSRSSLCEELHAAGRARPHHPAVVAQDAQLTHAELEHAIALSAHTFGAWGVAPGDDVLVQLPNSAAYVVTLFALMRIGAVPTLMLPSHRQAETAALCEALRPVAYIGGRDQLGFDGVDMIERMGPEKLGIAMIGADQGEERPGSVPRHVLPDPQAATGGDAVPPVHWPDPRSVALNLLSGGTTSDPKIIPRVHEAYAYNARAAAERCGVGTDTVYMTVLSAAHDLPLAQPGIIGTLLNGGTVVMCPSAAFDEAFAAVGKHRVTLVAIVPAIAQIWCEAAEWFPSDFSSLERIIIGAAALDVDLGRQLMDRFGVVIQQGYGLGEGITTFTSVDDAVSVALSTQGKPISDADVMRIVDSDGHQVAPGTPGEIIEKGPYTFFGYLGERSHEDCFTSDGFFRTGDRGYLTPDGDLVLCGRVAEQINRLGENVSPPEVERLLREINGIHDAAVFAMPDDQLGERTVAALVTDQGLDRSIVLEQFLSKGVARYKVPDEILMVKEIPMSNIGKADKKRLRAMLQERPSPRDGQTSGEE